MKNKLFNTSKCAMVLAACLFSSMASATLVDWTWTGNGTATASGSFSYDDALEGTGVITASAIDTFSIEGVLNGSTLFSWDLSDGTTGNPFQFSFDTTAFDIVKGGYWPTALDSVVFGDDKTGALICGTGSCGLYGSSVPGGSAGWRNVGEDQFTFTRVVSASVPEPGTLGLLGLGLAALSFSRRKAKA